MGQGTAAVVGGDWNSKAEESTGSSIPRSFKQRTKRDAHAQTQLLYPRALPTETLLLISLFLGKHPRGFFLNNRSC